MNYETHWIDGLIQNYSELQIVRDLALIAKSQHDQLEEALGIIQDLADLHDSYIGYLVSHNMYNDVAAGVIGERINVLRLKQ